jgi:hypothetical protein
MPVLYELMRHNTVIIYPSLFLLSSSLNRQYHPLNALYLRRLNARQGASIFRNMLRSRFAAGRGA